MKRIVTLAMAIIMCALCLVSCGSGRNDVKRMEKEGKLFIGITYVEPMNYKDADGNLVGFETEFAKAVCKELGVEAEFVEIEWDTKEIELKGKTIDCIWNGMTITDERKENMSISNPYMNNKQVLVVKSENVSKYTDTASLAGAKIVAEKESAGEAAAQAIEGIQYTGVASQKDAIMEVAAGTADACVVDYVLSIGMIGEGTSYANLVVDNDFAFSPEQYGIAFRKNSDLTEKVNAAIQKLIDDGTLIEIAKKYKLQDVLITNK